MASLNEVYNGYYKNNNEKEFSKNKSKTYKNKDIPKKKIKSEMIFKDDCDTSDYSDNESNIDNNEIENDKLASYNPLPEKKIVIILVKIYHYMII